MEDPEEAKVPEETAEASAELPDTPDIQTNSTQEAKASQFAVDKVPSDREQCEAHRHEQTAENARHDIHALLDNATRKWASGASEERQRQGNVWKWVGAHVR